MHLEQVSNTFLPPGLRQSKDDHKVLKELGLTKPKRTLPNWWRQVHTAQEIPDLAAAVIDALVRAYRVHPDDIAHPLGLPPRPYQGDPCAPLDAEVDDEGLVLLPAHLERDFQAYVPARRAPVRHQSPWECDFPPAFLTIVDRAEPSALLELVALAPAGPTDSRVTWFRRARDSWVLDPSIPDKLRKWAVVHLDPVKAAEVEPRMLFPGAPVEPDPALAGRLRDW